jgi:hypothetical protein
MTKRMFGRFGAWERSGKAPAIVAAAAPPAAFRKSRRDTPMGIEALI